MALTSESYSKFDLPGLSVFDCRRWVRDGVACQCCGKTVYHHIALQVFRWGADLVKTKIFMYAICKDCVADEGKVQALVLSDCPTSFVSN